MDKGRTKIISVAIKMRQPRGKAARKLGGAATMKIPTSGKTGQKWGTHKEAS